MIQAEQTVAGCKPAAVGGTRSRLVWTRAVAASGDDGCHRSRHDAPDTLDQHQVFRASFEFRTPYPKYTNIPITNQMISRSHVVRERWIIR